ncbi:hypothetical protein ACJMK2_012654 [Sinanodonta woodiana]|uniref:BED-type domain-containing protein n=1 Tax=Sinanodonta woodiana TaxID=1069815 RepID=A0ABD3VB77_SINWO
MPGCKFQDKWLTNNAFKSWIRKDTSNSHGAFCQLCNKSIDLTSMGKTALTSHSKGKKHKENEDRLRSGNIQVFMHSYKIHSTTPATTSAVTIIPSDTTMSSSQSAVSLSSYITKSETLNAEVWWCLKTVASNYSSNEETSFTFQQMFSDYVIAKSMSCGETKSMYITCLGIAPYLKSYKLILFIILFCNLLHLFLLPLSYSK